MFLAVPLILDTPRPVVVTGTRSDVVLLTATRRRAVGRTLAFDPQGIAGWPEVLRWDPVAGCQDPEEALDRGKAWAAGGDSKSGGGNVHWFNERAGEVLGYLLHAAAVKAGGSMRDVLAWASNFDDDEPANLLRGSAAVRPARWAELLTIRIRPGRGRRPMPWA